MLGSISIFVEYGAQRIDAQRRLWTVRSHEVASLGELDERRPRTDKLQSASSS